MRVDSKRFCLVSVIMLTAEDHVAGLEQDELTLLKVGVVGD